MPEMSKTVSVRIDPPQQDPDVQAEDGDDRDDRRSHGVSPDEDAGSGGREELAR